MIPNMVKIICRNRAEKVDSKFSRSDHNDDKYYLFIIIHNYIICIYVIIVMHVVVLLMYGYDESMAQSS